MIKVIINADDFGLNSLVNSHIESAIESEAISSTTILANTDSPEFVKKVHDKYRDKVSFGIHLNLTQGQSLTNSYDLHRYGIVDENGNFTRDIHKIKSFDNIILNAIEKEWTEQIKRLKNFGITLSHIDGHHHVHGLIPLRNLLIKVAKENDIGNVRSRYRFPLIWSIGRFGKESSSDAHSPIIEEVHRSQESLTKTTVTQRNYISLAKSVIQDFVWRKAILSSGLKTTDYFEQYTNIFNKLNSGFVLPDNCIVELMCHPGHLAYEREEYAITTNRLSEVLKYSLITYNEL